MKKYILKILLFFVIVACVDIVYGFVCKYMTDNTHSGGTARMVGLLKKNKYDMMIMGSSRCVCHYDDKMMSDSLGLNIVNAGQKGNGIVLMYSNYHIIPQEHKPQVLIYDLEPSFDVIEYKGDDHNRRYLNPLKTFYDEPGIKNVFSSIDPREPVKMNSQLYRYNSKLFTLIQNFLIHEKIRYSCYLPTDKEYRGTIKKKPEEEISCDSLKLFYFEQLIKETQTDNVEMIVVASPKYGATSKREIMPIVELCRKYDVPFWDYYYDMHDTIWFCDDMHLNYYGSQEFTKIVIQRIKDENLINKNENTIK